MDSNFEMESRILDMAAEIARLEREVGFATLPFISLETYQKDAAREQGLNAKGREIWAPEKYLDFLEGVKREKDRDSYLWQKMKMHD